MLLHEYLDTEALDAEIRERQAELARPDGTAGRSALAAPNGAVIKEIKRDSFGIPYYDSFPGFVLPIGFAGGLEDPDTGLVRFGWRDYDPTIGRFTSLDPARDRRGDGDLIGRPGSARCARRLRSSGCARGGARLGG